MAKRRYYKPERDGLPDPVKASLAGARLALQPEALKGRPINPGASWPMLATLLSEWLRACPESERAAHAVHVRTLADEVAGQTGAAS